MPHGVDAMPLAEILGEDFEIVIFLLAADHAVSRLGRTQRFIVNCLFKVAEQHTGSA